MIRSLAVFCTLLLLATRVPAQKIQMTTSAAVLDQVTISDVDFGRSTSPKWLFTIELNADPPDESVKDLVIEITGDLKFASGKAEQDVMILKSLPFELKGRRVFTNIDLSRLGIKGEYTFDNTKIDRLGVKYIALSSTRLPSGIYTLNISVYQNLSGSPGPELAHGKIVFVISNPSTVELLFPPDGDTGVGQYPLFQWIYDGPQSRISVYERLSEQGSLEDAASGVAQLVQEVPGTSFLYPTSGARVLQPGKSYVWFVEGLVQSAGGTVQTIRSQLRSFTVAIPGTSSTAPTESILDILERALGPKYKSIFDQIRSGEYSASGQLTQDGSSITPEQLRSLVNRFQENPDIVRAVRVE
jgi:hypothetical protein